MVLQAAQIPTLHWLETDLLLKAHAPPRCSHPLVVLEGLLKGVFETAGLNARQIKQLWFVPGVAHDALRWEAGTTIPIRLQLFGLAPERLGPWHSALEARFNAAWQNFELIDASAWRVTQAPAPAEHTKRQEQWLDFLTPVPLPHKAGQARTAIDPDGFLRLCQTRLRKLFGQEAELTSPPQLDPSGWRYTRIIHRSHSQKGHPMYLHGCVGPLRLAGESLAQWQPWLALLEAVGMGERLSFAQGRFRLLNAPPQSRASAPTAERAATTATNACQTDCGRQARPDKLEEYKPQQPASPRQDETQPAPLRLRRPYYVEQALIGARLHLDNANLVIQHDQLSEQRQPLMRLSSLIIQTPVEISSALLHACAEEGIPVVLAAPGQKTLVITGQASEYRRNQNLAAHHHAHGRLDEPARAKMAAWLIEAKLSACEMCIRRRYHPGDHDLIKRLQRARAALQNCRRIDQVRGWEGWAARHYGCWLARQARDVADYPGRRKRKKAQDPINLLLNYGYALLRHRVGIGVRLAGLDPYLGILHQANGRHEALVSDLMEPWRPYIDRLILRMLGLRMLQTASLLEEGESRLSSGTRFKLIQAMTELMEKTPADGGARLSHRIMQGILEYRKALLHGHPPSYNSCVPQATDEEDGHERTALFERRCVMNGKPPLRLPFGTSTP